LGLLENQLCAFPIEDAEFLEPEFEKIWQRSKFTMQD
jgi:hypothetical protein